MKVKKPYIKEQVKLDFFDGEEKILCVICKEYKPVSEFYKNIYDREGIVSYCKDCSAKIHQERRDKNWYIMSHKKSNKKYDSSEKGMKRNRGYFVNTRLKYLLHAVRHRAKKDGKEFDLDMDWVNENSKNGCQLCGLPFDPNAVKRPGLFSASIDRIDNTRGYTKDNCRVILFGLNAFKNIGTDAEMNKIIKAYCKKQFGRDYD